MITRRFIEYNRIELAEISKTHDKKLAAISIKQSTKTKSCSYKSLSSLVNERCD